MKIKHRHRLRRKEVADIAKSIYDILGVRLFQEDDPVDKADLGQYTVFILKHDIMAMEMEGIIYPTLKGLLKEIPEKGHVTVDMGAVPFVCDGADIMAPGVTNASPELKRGNLAWVRDQKNGQPLAVVKLLMDGNELVEKQKGKGAKNIHFVGDKLWCHEV